MLKTKTGQVIVRFVESSGAYGVGTRAAFSEKAAAKLVEEGTAQYVGGPTGLPASAKQAPRAEMKPKEEPQAEAEEPAEDPLAPVRDNPDWKMMNGNTLRAIASKVSNLPINSKFDAIGIIESKLGGE